jgi:putative peptide maturation dehydrogenase
MPPGTRRIRRSPHVFLYLEDDPAPVTTGNGATHVVALCILTGRRYQLSDDEWALLQGVSAREWSTCDPEAEGTIQSLLENGLLVCDGDDEPLATLRERDENLLAAQWNGYAALFHYMTQWSGVGFVESGEAPVEVKARARTFARALLDVYGPPPGEFAEFGSGPVVELPGIDREGDFYRVLAARRTTRAFDTATQMTLAELDTVLRYVFGCHGYGRNSADVVCIKRTSPSGGGLAPVEAYAIVSDVQDVTPGVYHYNGRDHTLVVQASKANTDNRTLATQLMCGQSYFGAAHVTFVLTARFYRNHWKYRRHQKSYPGILMDAAHLSQTLYLVAAELDLGAFVTLAINARDAESLLGLDGVNEGVIAMAGCGPRVEDGSPLDLQFSVRPPVD